METQTAPVHALEGRYYTDPDIFKIECNGLFRRTWQFAGHISQVPTIGDYFTVSIGGENLFCIRTGETEIRAFYNVCQHRAHELVQGSGNARLLVCPYHAWTYELTGHLRSGPNIRSVPGFDRTGICLTPVRLEEFCGFLFVNLDPDAEPMDQWFPEVRRQLSAFVPDHQRLQPVQWVEVPELCNWKVSIENYSECYHCRLNHETFSTGVVKPETYDIQPQGYCLRHTTQCQNLDRMSYPVDLQSNAHAGEYSAWFLWPMFSFQVYPGNLLNTYHWRPVDVDRVVVWRGWYTLDGLDCEIVGNLAEQDRNTTVEEDIHLVQSVQRGLKSSGYTPGPLVVDPAHGVNSEHAISCLQDWIRQAVDK